MDADHYMEELDDSDRARARQLGHQVKQAREDLIEVAKPKTLWHCPHCGSILPERDPEEWLDPNDVRAQAGLIRSHGPSILNIALTQACGDAFEINGNLKVRLAPEFRD